MDVDDTDLSGVLVQGTKERYKVVSMIGRELLVTEQRCSIIERLAIAASWCIKKLNCYNQLLPTIWLQDQVLRLCTLMLLK